MTSVLCAIMVMLYSYAVYDARGGARKKKLCNMVSEELD